MQVATLLKGCLAAAVLAASSTLWAEEDGFRPIFDGKTLEGWDGNPDFWRVEDGCIVGQTTPEKPTKGNTFIIWRGGEPADFELKVEFKLTNHNSGVQVRSFEKPEEWGKWVAGGYQADIEESGRYMGICYGERFRGILAMRGDRTVIGADHKPTIVGKVGDADELLKKIDLAGWNEYHIIARGWTVTQKINGNVVAEVTDEDEEVRRAKGLIAFQLHAGPPMKVAFRNVMLKELAEDTAAKDGGKKRIVFVAGTASHGYGGHEHNAGCKLLAKRLEESGLPVETVVYENGWPQDANAFDGADAIVIYANGGGGHPILPHLEQVEPLMKKGVGLACLHYAVEVPKEQAGRQFLDWIGGYFETHWSVNPWWTAHFKQIPEHPVTRGVKPFSLHDEWYYHMRFRPDMEGVTPLLTAIPPDSTRERPDGPHSNNPTVRERRGEPEHLGWVYDRPDGSRGFGFTGGHWHWAWAHDDFRTFVLNGIAWTAGLDIPAGGVPAKSPDYEELLKHQDYPQPDGFTEEKAKAS
ncbi:MAG: family 16 glycoside hydrolase, partial [Patescibacteria group bacterium]|nr:family 16 glycoside hydrolase [Patescibacteria group bacterium]